MKKLFNGIICAGLLLAGAGIARAQERPETIHRITKIQYAPEWYATQQKLWEREVALNPQSEEAWFNYFKATRYAGMMYRGYEDTDGESARRAKAERMEKLLADMERAIPNTFTAHYVKWWNGGNQEDLFPELEKAYAIRQDYAELSDDFITYYEMHGNEEQVKFFSQKLYQSKDMPTGLLEYNYNVLVSLEKNAVIITTGDNDTYPLWLLQYAKGIRPDVTVLNVSLATDPAYRTMKMKKYNIKGDGSRLDMERLDTTPYATCVAEFLKSVAESNTARPIYFALTCDPQYLEPIKGDLYTVGLANRYSPDRIDNIALLKRNWNAFRLDYLDLDFYNEDYPFTLSPLSQLNMNYVTPALLLYEHYRLSGETEKASRYREFALRIARQGEQAEEVEQYLAGLDAGETTEGTTEQQKTADAEREKSTLGRDVMIVPNPATDAITIRMPDASEAEVQLVDMQGKVLRTMTTRQQEIRISTEGAAAGTYVVHIKTAKGHFSKNVQIIR